MPAVVRVSRHSCDRYATPLSMIIRRTVISGQAWVSGASFEADTVLGVKTSGNETPRQLRGRQERNARILRCLEEVKAEEAARGQDEASIAARAQAKVDRARQGRSGGGPLPQGVDRIAVAAARVEAAQERLHQAQARKRERIIEVREQLRLAQAGLGPKPNLGLFSFDETKGVEVSRAKQRLSRAENALASEESTARQPAEPPSKRRQGKKEPSAARRQVRRNVTDPDSRMMSAADGGAVQGYNAQLAVAGDGLILASELTQDANDQHQFQPMSQAAVQAAKLIHTSRCDRQCTTTTTGGCCVTASSTAASCGQPACPCAQDALGVLLLDNGYCTNDNLQASGPDRLIATSGSRDRRKPAEPLEPLPGNADARTRMTHRLSTTAGAELYKKRASTVEPVNGHVKDRIGLRRFTRRGKAACQSELDFAAMVLNLRKLLKLSQVKRATALTSRR